MKQFNLAEWIKDKSRKVVTRDGREVEILKTNRKDDTHPIIFTILGQNGVEQVHFCNKDGICTTLPRPNKFDLFFADGEKELTEFEKAVQNILNEPHFQDIEAVKQFSKTLLDLARKELGKENSEFKPKFTYNEKYYSKLANKLIEFRNNTPLCSVCYRDGEGRKIILHYEKEILDLVRKELEKSIEDGAIEFAKSYMEDVNPSFEKVQESEELWKWKMSCLKGVNKAYTNGKQDALKESPKWKKCDDNLPYSHIGGLNNRYLIKDGYCIKISDLETLPKEE